VHVVIIGAGEVGGYLAKRLRDEGLDVVMVELDEHRAAAIGDELDIQVVLGSGSNPSVLKEAGIGRTTILAAVTQNDEVNLLASLIAKQHGVETTVVRVETEGLRDRECTDLLAAVGADVVIDPDAETADEILELIHATGADEVYPMADGELVVIGAVVSEGSELANRNLEEIGRSMGDDADFLVGAVTRDSETVIPGGSDEILPGDHLRVLCKTESQPQLLMMMGAGGNPARRVMVLGGGSVGFRLARRLEYEGVEVVLIERDMERAKRLAQHFRRASVVQGDVTDTELLIQESIGSMDNVVAATGEDSANVLACAFAIAEGAGFTVAVMHRLALLPLVRRLGIDAALSPRTALANAVLRKVRGGATAVATFLESDSEVDEIVIQAGSRADTSLVADLNLPEDILIGAVTRPGRQAEIARGQTMLNAEDHVVIFGRANALAEAKALFES